MRVIQGVGKVEEGHEGHGSIGGREWRGRRLGKVGITLTLLPPWPDGSSRIF